MPGIADKQEISDKVHIVLRGADGKIKDERKPKENKTEVRIDVPDKRPRI